MLTKNKKKTTMVMSQSPKGKNTAPEAALSTSATPRTSGSLKSSLGPGKHRAEESAAEAEEPLAREAGQSRSRQGLSDVADAGSESGNELLEELPQIDPLPRGAKSRPDGKIPRCRTLSRQDCEPFRVWFGTRLCTMY